MLRRWIPTLLTVAGCSALVAAGATAAARSRHYSGQTSDHQPISFTIRGNKVKNFKTVLTWNANCSGGGPSYTVATPSIKIRRNKTFSRIVGGSGPPSSVSLDFKVHGKVSGRKVNGTVLATKSSCIDKSGMGPNHHGYSASFKLRAH